MHLIQKKANGIQKKLFGIDKGISMIMIENYLSQLIWKLFMKNEYVQEGLKILKINKKNNNLEILSRS